MSVTTLQFKKDTAIELAFATVTEGMEGQLFGDYFPKVMPIIMELGGKPLGSFGIAKAATNFGHPKMGVFFQWPTIETFDALHDESRFLEIKSIRDDALSFFCNGNFFESQKDQELSFEEGQEFALITLWSEEENMSLSPIINLRPLDLSLKQDYRPMQVLICPWSDGVEDLLLSSLKGTSDKAREPDVFKIAFNPPK